MKKQFWMAVAGAGSLLLAGCSESSDTAEVAASSTETLDTNKKESQNLPLEKIDVTIDGALDEFLKNKLRLEQKFEKKEIVITGIFETYSTNFSGDPQIAFANFLSPSSKYYSGVATVIDSEKSSIVELNPGDLIKVNCKIFDISRSVTYPEFKDCGDIEKYDAEGNEARSEYQSLLMNDLGI